MGVDGLRQYLLEKRLGEFTDNLCCKLLAYALGRGLLLSDEPLLEEMQSQLVATDYRLSSLVQTIVSSPQFVNRRGRDFGVTPQ